VRWIGSARNDIRGFPEEVRSRVGGALWEAQLGRKAPFSKPLRGFGGAGVLEIVDDFDGDTYRAVYTVRFAGVVYVLHAWHCDAEARNRIDWAALETGQGGLSAMAKRTVKRPDTIAVTPGSGNVFADLGVTDPQEELAKAQLASAIRQAIQRRRLTQTRAAELMGLDQPKVSALMNGKLGGFSSDRLLRFLTALGQDVEIVVKAKSRGRARGHIRVIEAARQT
jgi:predicted XRE-type DNA-binding protein/phage-related protein